MAEPQKGSETVGFEGERSPKLALGALTLPYKASGSVIMLPYPSEGALLTFKALTLPLSFSGSIPSL
jgi:hypothetical protein